MKLTSTTNGTVSITSGSLWDSRLAVTTQSYILAKLCSEDKEQLDRIEAILNGMKEKKEYVQIKVHK